MAETRTRTFRVSEDVWTSALERAAANDETVSDVLRQALADYTCDSCGTCDVCGLDQIAPEDYETLAEPSPSAAVWGFGAFDETTNPEVQALIDRARELLAVGAVGVSIATDLNPADLPANPNDVTDEILEAAHIRPRHVAIVDTAAFSGAFLSVTPDGGLEGPIVFEGTPTGDVRGLPLESLTWDDDLFPIPVIFDIHEGDHTGAVVGHIDRVERVTGDQVSDADNVVPIAASASAYPAYLFSEPEPGPVTIHAPDANGYRRYTGTIAPANVCHKGKPGCYTYRGADLDYFHTGASIPLDDGTFIRVGPLVMGGPHADDQEMDYAEALARTEDARRVFAMGRCYHHPAGLLFSGVLMPDADIMRIQATGPSVEIWPNEKGKMELKTALHVNVKGWPMVASVGGGIQLTEAEPVIVEERSSVTLTVEPDSASEKRLTELETVVGELYAAHLASTFDAN